METALETAMGTAIEASGQATAQGRPVIMVQVDAPQWTADVLHAACRLARTCGGEVALVRLVRVRRLLYLGTEFGNLDLSDDDKRHLEACVDTVEDYGLPYSVTLYQHCDLCAAIADTAELVGAGVVFARLPHSSIPLWSDCQFELLRMRLSRRHVELLNAPGIWGQAAPLRAAEAAA